MVAIARVPAFRRTSRLINGGLWQNLLLIRALIHLCENLLDSVEPPVEEGVERNARSSFNKSWS